ncbi:MAG TPA: hypothetical protein VMG11_02500 [Steroidobacteraceae bacterium]|nr:hypothetical protein [Steroidobacteraceae bacterium]
MHASTATAPAKAPADRREPPNLVARIDLDAAYGCVDWFIYQATTLASRSEERASAAVLLPAAASA